MAHHSQEHMSETSESNSVKAKLCVFVNACRVFACIYA